MTRASRVDVCNLLVLAGLLACSSHAEAVTARLEADAYTSSASTASNYGAKPSLEVAGPAGSVRRSYVRFDLSTLPPGLTGADIEKATLTVFIDKVSTAGSFDVVRVNGPWSEATLTSGVEPALAATEQSAIAVSLGDKSQFKTIDVTAVVRDWLDGALANNGLALVGNPVDGLKARFNSKENKANSQAPRLEVVLGNGAGSVTSVSAASPLSVTNGNTTPNITLGTVPVASGGTGATAALTARTNLGAAASGANSDITGLSGLVTPLSLVQGGTNASSASSARANLGAAASGANSDITALSGLTTPLALAQGGTNASSAAGARTSLGAASSGANADITSLSGLTTPLALSQGGTGAATGPAARSSLGAAASGANADITSLSAITDANLNTRAGASALSSLTTGTANTAFGDMVLNLNDTGNSNTAVGATALQNNTSGSFNTAVGTTALYVNTTGSDNAALGVNALLQNTTGARNTGVGTYALGFNDTGNSNTAVGRSALVFNVSGTENTAVGDRALASNTTAYYNTAVGRECLFSNTTAWANSAVGWRALYSNDTGDSNTAMGAQALEGNTSGIGNTAVGFWALRSNTTAGNNTAVGGSALNSNTTGSSNAAVGQGALLSNTTGSRNTAVGTQAMFNATVANDNTALGFLALAATAASGGQNTALGSQALFSDGSGSNNAAMGYSALKSNVSGNNNVAVGYQALQNLTSGNANHVFGYQSGLNLTSGNDNIYIASASGASVESNTIRIGQPGIQNRAFIVGIRGVTTGVANGIPVLIDSNGQLGTISSSARFKTDVHDMGDVSGRLMDLRPVTFRYKPDLDPSETVQYGLIAEEVERVFPELVAYDKDGRIETVKYHLLSALLLNEMQKQQRVTRAQADELTRLRAAVVRTEQLAHDNDVLRQRVDHLEQSIQQIGMRPQPAAAKDDGDPGSRRRDAAATDSGVDS